MVLGAVGDRVTREVRLCDTHHLLIEGSTFDLEQAAEETSHQRLTRMAAGYVYNGLGGEVVGDSVASICEFLRDGHPWSGLLSEDFLHSLV